VDYKQLFRKKEISQIISEAELEHSEGQSLARNLSLRDLTAFAVAAIIGAGIFGTIGNASANGGPAVSLLFVFTAIACSFSALCYAEFASKIPISGSAYTYAYASMGELVAWIIGWDLLMEYSVGNIAVAISWSDYFTSFLKGFHVDIPYYLCTDFFGASRGFNEVKEMLASGTSFDFIPQYLREAYLAWSQAPQLFGIKLVADIPAFLIVVLITVLVYVGIKESKRTNNILVLLKVFVILLVVAVGSFYVQPGNWSPFSPNGLSGVLKGVSAVFFAYIGFDAISTTAEECKNPQRDLPKAMIYSLIVCTLLYVAITLVLTGMVHYNELAVGDPLSFVFEKVHLPWLSGVIALSAIIAMASVLLVFQLGQPRIWMSMSRDGLLPSKFGKIHKRFRTPAFSTIVTGVVVGIPSLFLNLTEVTDLTSIGTLFAFIVVCAGQLNHHKSENNGTFKMPYVNGKYIVPALFLITLITLAMLNRNIFRWMSFSDEWDIVKHKLPYILFFIVGTLITIQTFRKSYSLIPVLGLLTNFYLMTELGYVNWLRFLIWLVAGLIIYFCFGINKSKLRKV
jgi:amino acid transporter